VREFNRRTPKVGRRPSSFDELQCEACEKNRERAPHHLLYACLILRPKGNAENGAGLKYAGPYEDEEGCLLAGGGLLDSSLLVRA
jgi:hypothetical protein